MKTPQQQADAQKQLDIKHAEYLAAFRSVPRNEALCLTLALECLEIAKGTPLESRFASVIKRHSK